MCKTLWSVCFIDVLSTLTSQKKSLQNLYHVVHHFCHMHEIKRFDLCSGSVVCANSTFGFN